MAMPYELRLYYKLCEDLQPGVVAVDPRKRVFSHDAHGSLDSYCKDFFLYNFLRKWKGFEGQKPDAAALRTWHEAELRCFRTNRRLELEASAANFSVDISIVEKSQRIIADILGPIDYERIARLCRFSSGATLDLRRGSTVTEKSIAPTINPNGLEFAERVTFGDTYLRELLLSRGGPRESLENRMVMVPKNFATSRPIAAEPTFSAFMQQGIGRRIRERLTLFGVDLDDQTINQGLARKGLKYGFSTIDLSSASDTLCTNLVKLLLPREWVELLTSVRSTVTSYKGRRYHLSKFSSMGNAYTFELESMIFFALCKSTVGHGIVSVYGDDIIVSDRHFSSVVKTLEWAGFKINYDKSFTLGSRYRESCGSQYFDGMDVTPCFQKDVCRGPHDFVRLHNRLVRAGRRLGLSDELRDACSDVRRFCRSQFGSSCPGVGPLVEYDEYFIKTDYAWPELADRVKVRSAVLRNQVSLLEFPEDQLAAFSQKLRRPGFLNSDPRGYVSRNRDPKLVITDKYHWRSATIK